MNSKIKMMMAAESLAFDIACIMTERIDDEKMITITGLIKLEKKGYVSYVIDHMIETYDRIEIVKIA